MKGSTLSHLLKSLSFIAILFSFHFAFAGLDEDESSVQKDHDYFQGRGLTVVDKGTHKIHQIVRPDGSFIHEYTGNGRVFAISWRGGYTHPNLQHLLGSHFNEYKDADAKYQVPQGKGYMAPAARGRPPRVVKVGNIVVILGGHMGNVTGQAYSTSSMPAGITANDFLAKDF